jgi:hypothetical protein
MLVNVDKGRRLYAGAVKVDEASVVLGEKEAANEQAVGLLFEDSPEELSVVCARVQRG